MLYVPMHGKSLRPDWLRMYRSPLSMPIAKKTEFPAAHTALPGNRSIHLLTPICVHLTVEYTGPRATIAIKSSGQPGTQNPRQLLRTRTDGFFCLRVLHVVDRDLDSHRSEGITGYRSQSATARQCITRSHFHSECQPKRIFWQ